MLTDRSELGEELMNELESQLRSMGIQNIWLWTSGVPTIKFYERQGYAKFTEMENWYSDGSSRVGFRKTIAE